jgi:hypothetical protein
MYYNIHESFPSELTVQVLAQCCYFVLLSGFFCLILAYMLSPKPLLTLSHVLEKQLRYFYLI